MNGYGGLLYSYKHATFVHQTTHLPYTFALVSVQISYLLQLIAANALIIPRLYDMRIFRSVAYMILLLSCVVESFVCMLINDHDVL